MKKIVSVLLCVMMIAVLAAGCGSSDAGSGGKSDSSKTKDTGDDKTANPEEYQVVMIVKQSDSWFDDMTTGVEQLKKDTGLNVSVQVPEDVYKRQCIRWMEKKN